MTGAADFSHETAARVRGFWPVAGVDEAGRGPLCGPVVAAAVILDPDRIPPGLNDSKKLTAARREALFAQILAQAECGVGLASPAEIDELNILRASHLAMERAIAALPRPPAHVLIDGNLIPRGLATPAEAVVKGDALCLTVAAASVVAKVTRDRIMVDLAQQHPGYGWAKNAGYPTRDHLAALQILGVTPHHRRSFKPVHNILYQAKSISA
ncbi:MAG: ribonuclease HII [Paracoccaceae bacterium]